jgi:hypothetical protein
MTPEPARTDESRGTWYVAAIVLLGAAMQRNFGFYDPLGVVLILLALAAAGAGIGGARVAPRFGVDRALKVGLLAELLFMLIGRQGVEILLTAGLDLRPYAVGMAAISVAVLAQLAGRFSSERWGFPVVLVAVAGLGWWTILSSPSPHIDVFVFQQNASSALLHGTNPYQMRFPDIYGPGSPFYGPGLSDGHQTLFGFPYPPLSLLFAAAGYAVAGDYRFAVLGAYLLAAIFIWLSSGTSRGRYAAQLLLLVPINLFVIEEGWSEPFAGALLALVVLLDVRRPQLTPIALGLLMAIKQYLVGVPAVAWYFSVALRRRAGTASGVLAALVLAVAITLPLAVLAAGDFVLSVIGFQLRQPFRADALNLGGLIHTVAGWEMPAYVGFVALAVALMAALRFAPRSPSGFAAVLAVTYLAFFFFGRWAFVNYYWFVIASFCASLAGGSGPKVLARDGRATVQTRASCRTLAS